MARTGFVKIQGKELYYTLCLLQQGHLEPVAWIHVWTDFECPGGWRLSSLPGQLMPVPGHSHSEKVFADVQSVSVCAHCLWCCE